MCRGTTRGAAKPVRDRTPNRRPRSAASAVAADAFGSLGLAPPAARATLARKVGEGGAVGTLLSKPAEASVRDRRSATAGAHTDADAQPLTAGAAARRAAQYTSRT